MHPTRPYAMDSPRSMTHPTRTRPQSQCFIARITEHNNIMYRIFSYLTGNPIHEWSDINQNVSLSNPPLRQSHYKETLSGFRDLVHFMLASKQVYAVIQETKLFHSDDPYPYVHYREFLITETCLQLHYKQLNLAAIPPPNTVDSPDIGDMPDWLRNRSINAKVYGKHVITRKHPITGLYVLPMECPEIYRELNPDAMSFDTTEEICHIMHDHPSYNHEAHESLKAMRTKRALKYRKENTDSIETVKPTILPMEPDHEEFDVQAMAEEHESHELGYMQYMIQTHYEIQSKNQYEQRPHHTCSVCIFLNTECPDCKNYAKHKPYNDMTTKAIAYNIGYANALADQASSEPFRNAYKRGYDKASSKSGNQECYNKRPYAPNEQQKTILKKLRCYLSTTDKSLVLHKPDHFWMYLLQPDDNH